MALNMQRDNFDSKNDGQASSAADVLKKVMKQHHITQNEFAKHAAISQKQLSFILNHRAFMSVQVARQIEQATGLDARWLLHLDLDYRFTNQNIDRQMHVNKFPWVTDNHNKL